MESYRASSVEADDMGVGGIGADGRPWHLDWGDLVAVDVRTTSEGPFDDDVFFVLVHRVGVAVIVPQSVTPTDVLARLQRLPGFDNETFIAAMGCTEDQTFPCWRAGA